MKEFLFEVCYRIQRFVVAIFDAIDESFADPSVVRLRNRISCRFGKFFVVVGVVEMMLIRLANVGVYLHDRGT